MELNMFIIYEDLKDLNPQAKIHGDRLKRDLIFHSPLRKGDQFAYDCVYIVNASQMDGLPYESMLHYPCFVCAGTPPEEALASNCSIIWFPEGVSIDDLVIRMTSIYNTYARWESQMKDALGKGSTLRHLAELSMPIIRRPLWLWDAYYQTIFNVIDETLYTLPEDYLRQDDNTPWTAWQMNTWEEQTAEGERSQLLSLHTPFFMPSPPEGPVGSYRCLSNNVFIDGKRVATVCMDEVGGEITDRDYAIIVALSDFFEMSIRYGAVLNISMSVATNQCVRMMVDGETVKKNEMLTALHALGWHRDDRFLCFIVEPDSNLYTDRLLSSTAGRVATALPDLVYFLRAHRIVFIARLQEEAHSDERLVKEVLRLLNAEKLQMHLGVSDPWYGFNKLSCCFRQATEALRIGEESEDRTSCYLFSEYLTQALSERYRGDDDAEILRPIGLRKLMVHDRTNGDDLVSVMRAYLDSNCSASQAARELFVSRSTLIHKLEKIENIADVDFDDPECRIQLNAALRL